MIHHPQWSRLHDTRGTSGKLSVPRMMSALRNLALGVLHAHGITKIKATLQRLDATRPPDRPA
jgi:hypothetical protein